jgi:hypothetical protein
LILICLSVWAPRGAFQTEGTPPEEAMNPAVKRSGWTAPQDTGLWKITDALRAKLWVSLPPHELEYLKVRSCGRRCHRTKWIMF